MGLMNRAGAKSALGDIAGAVKDCNNSLKIYDNVSTAWCHLGRNQMKQKKKKSLVDAMASFDKALELDNNLVEAWAIRGRVKFEQEDMKGAVADCSEALR